MNVDDVTGPINIGNPHERTILDLAEHVIDLTGSDSNLIRKPLPPDDPTQRCPDITLASKCLGWSPQVELRDGLDKTIAYFAGLDLSEWTPPTPYWEAPPAA